MTERQATWIWSACTVAAAGLVAWLITMGSATTNDPRASEQSFHQWMHANLKMPEEQHRQLEPFENAYEVERLRLRQEIREAGNALARAVREGSRESPQVASALDRLHAAQGELQRITLDHFFTMRDHLDPEQAERLGQWIHDNILHGSPH